MEPKQLPIQDILDLHTFRPKDVPQLLTDYFEACIDAGIFSVRVIHGKGQGILKKRVHALLRAHPSVVSYGDAPAEAGGWGATLVELQCRDSRKQFLSDRSEVQLNLEPPDINRQQASDYRSAKPSGLAAIASWLKKILTG